MHHNGKYYYIPDYRVQPNIAVNYLISAAWGVGIGENLIDFRRLLSRRVGTKLLVVIILKLV